MTLFRSPRISPTHTTSISLL